MALSFSWLHRDDSRSSLTFPFSSLTSVSLEFDIYFPMSSLLGTHFPTHYTGHIPSTLHLISHEDLKVTLSSFGFLHHFILMPLKPFITLFPILELFVHSPSSLTRLSIWWQKLFFFFLFPEYSICSVSVVSVHMFVEWMSEWMEWTSSTITFWEYLMIRDAERGLGSCGKVIMWRVIFYVLLIEK